MRRDRGPLEALLLLFAGGEVVRSSAWGSSGSSPFRDRDQSDDEPEEGHADQRALHQGIATQGADHRLAEAASAES